MTPPTESGAPSVVRGGGFSRIAAIGALVLIAIAVAFLLLSGGDSGNKYRLVFETGGQLVNGNEVLIGGQPVGSVEEVSLRDDGQAQVDIKVDQALHEGTTAVIRSTSLSGIANHYVSITPGPDNAPLLGDNSLITEVDTTAPVDLDQLFNTLREPERKGLQDIIQGSATAYAGRGSEANQTYKYLSPSIVATDNLIRQLNSDEQVLADFLVDGSRVVSAVAERRDDLAALTSNGNEALGAIASQNRNLDRALRALPPALRQANTTFFNLRPTLDDLDEFVDVAKPTTKDLAPLLRQVRPVVGKSVPVFKDLNLAVNRKGKNNDLADAAGKLVPIRNAASTSVPTTVRAMADSEPTFTFLRPYSPDLLNTIGKLGQISSTYDADGRLARIQPAGLNLFTNVAGTLNPIAPDEQFDDYCDPTYPSPPNSAGTPPCVPSNPAPPVNMRIFRRCPGGETQPAQDLSSPFLDNGMLTPGPPFPPGDCDPTDVPLGP